jgi:tetratricopeptide (TPR) repeat protein
VIHLERSAQVFINETCDYELLLPANRPGKQEILSYTYSIKPDALIKSESGEYIPTWKNLSFYKLKEQDLTADVLIRIYKYDLLTAKKKPYSNKGNVDTLSYLKAEENFEVKSKKIVRLADSINGSNREEVVHAVFDYVVSHLDYYRFEEQDRGAKKALKQGRGDCTEYSELMITLCRAKHIPAKIIMGLVIDQNGVIGYHNWVEVYFSQYGWVAFDPTHADGKRARTAFESMENKYIALSDRRWIRNISCSCTNSQYNFSLKLIDSHSDPVKEKYTRMRMLYKESKSKEVLPLLDSLLYLTPDDFSLYMYKGVAQARLGNFDTAVVNLQRALSKVKTPNQKGAALYGFANYLALKGDTDMALSYLKECFRLGMQSKEMLNDPDFENLKDNPVYIELQKELKAKPEK